jgi:DNA invertase Pin-like site-specific DNA recombinase
MKIGYCRVSTAEQNLDLQTAALEKAGVGKIFSDKISGIRAERGGLSELLAFAREGGTAWWCGGSTGSPGR